MIEISYTLTFFVNLTDKKKSAVLKPPGDNAIEYDPGYIEDAELLVLLFGTFISIK